MVVVRRVAKGLSWWCRNKQINRRDMQIDIYLFLVNDEYNKRKSLKITVIIK